jgi:hypothetical protein
MSIAHSNPEVQAILDSPAFQAGYHYADAASEPDTMLPTPEQVAISFYAELLGCHRDDAELSVYSIALGLGLDHMPATNRELSKVLTAIAKRHMLQYAKAACRAAVREAENRWMREYATGAAPE